MRTGTSVLPPGRRRGVKVWAGVAMVLGALAVAPPASAQADTLGRMTSALASSEYERAEQAWGELTAGQRNGPDGTYLRTRLLLHTGRYDEAVKVARPGMRGSAEHRARLAPWLAEAYERQGKVDEAIKALDPLKDADGAYRVKLKLGELLIRQGKLAEGRAALMGIFEAYNDDRITSRDAEELTLVGRAAALLQNARNANQAYNEAERAGAKKRVEALLWRAELFLDKFDPGHAAEVTKEALALAPNDPRVRVMMAHVRLAQTMDFASAEEQIDKALKVDPRLASAYFVRAGLALRTMDLAAADAALDQGLAVNPTDLELLSMKAATRFLAEDEAGFQAVKKKVLDLNPKYSRFFQIVGEYAEWEHRYDDIVAMMREAIKVDDRDAKAYATLGLNLIRSGEEQAGITELNHAWERDEYNVRVFNTLNLYEEVIAKDYVTRSGGRFRIRYHKSEAQILDRYLPAMLDQAWTSMVDRYGFTPQKPVGIEMYADPEHFSVRTSGLPSIGIQGVCFGKTLAALSPAAGSFNWGMVVWHELAHVFHIQMSKNRVPRWFTEGLAEYETIIQRPEWQREEDVALYIGLRDGKIPSVGAFNRAFTHVDDPRDVTMAYFAASQISVFMAERYGFSKVAAHLRHWADGKPTPEAVQEALGVSAEQLDAEFRAWLTPRLSRYDKQYVPDLRPPESLEEAQKAVAAEPKNAKRLVELAMGLLSEDKLAEAESTLQLALSMQPNQPDALYVKLRIAMQKRDGAGAKKLVEQMIAAGHDGYTVRMKAADIAEAGKDLVAMKKHLHEAHRLDPSQAEPLQAMYDLASKNKDESGQLDALRQLARLEQHDRRVWRRLLKMLVDRGLWKEAMAVGQSALYVDVTNPEVHRLYAEALARSGKHVSAIFELNSALVAGAKPKDAAAIYRTMAEGYRKLGKPEHAETAEAHAKQLDAAAPSAPDPEDESLREEATLRPEGQDQAPAHLAHPHPEM